ncbi:MAG TPA: CHAD domain-containing protein [Rhizomicrobium sp.]|nr:CHAD domain-containing protein [Rhizomicrobium sp.]
MVEGNVEIVRPVHERGSAARHVPRPVKARPVRLNEDMTAEDGFRVAVLECLAQISANIPAVRAREVEGVHQLRVGLRRLHTALYSFGDPFRVATVKRLRRRTKGLAGLFGPARDLDVFLEEVFVPVARSAQGNDALEFLRNRIEDARIKAWDEALAKLDEGGLQEFLDETAATAEGRSWGKGSDEPILETSSRALEESFLRARKRARRIGRGEDRDFHRLRIALKKLRYTAEFFEGLYRKKRLKDYLDCVRDLQDVLGAMHDAAAARQTLMRLTAEEPASARSAAQLAYASGLITGWHESRATGLADKARKRWKQLDRARQFWR